MIIFECGNCGRLFKVVDSAAGRKGKCKTCHADVIVPSSSTQLSQLPEQTVSPESGRVAKIQPRVAPRQVALQPVEVQAIEAEAVEVEAVETEAVETEAVETEAVETEAVEAEERQYQQSDSQVAQSIPGGKKARYIAAASLVCGIFALLTSWIPLLGLPAISLAATGILLGIASFIVAVVRNEGVTTSSVGICLSCVAIIMSLYTSATVVKVDHHAQYRPSGKYIYTSQEVSRLSAGPRPVASLDVVC